MKNTMNVHQSKSCCTTMNKKIIAIITRFNIDIRMASFKDKTYLNLDKEYLKKRFFLFENYYLKSLTSQTNKNFYSFVLMHPQTPEEFKERFFRLASTCSFKLVSIFVKNFNISIISKEIYEYIKAYELLISVRLDNDDSIAATFVEKLYAENNLKENHIISFSNGCVYDINSGFIMHYYNKQNHFLVYVEKLKNNFKTIYAISEHDKILENHPYIIFIDTKCPMWMENLHDCNILNKLVGRPMSHRLKKVVQEEYAFLPKLRLTPPPFAWLYLAGKVLQKVRQKFSTG